MKRRDPDLLEYHNKIRDARDNILFYVDLARRAKGRGDVSSFVDSWYKMKFQRLAALYWAKVLRERSLMIATLTPTHGVQKPM